MIYGEKTIYQAQVRQYIKKLIHREVLLYLSSELLFYDVPALVLHWFSVSVLFFSMSMKIRFANGRTTTRYERFKLLLVNISVNDTDYVIRRTWYESFEIDLKFYVTERRRSHFQEIDEDVILKSDCHRDIVSILNSSYQKTLASFEEKNIDIEIRWIRLNIRLTRK